MGALSQLAADVAQVERLKPVHEPRDHEDAPGTTVADALRDLKKAKYFYVCVPHGFGSDWSYCRVSKAEALRFLNSKKPADALSSNVHWSKFDERPSLFMGDFYDQSRANGGAR